MIFFRKISFSFAAAILLSYGSCSNERTPMVVDPPVNPPAPTAYTDPQIVEMVQKDALKYFWDFAESNSKLARERYHTDNPGVDATVVSAGGSGFGLMNILVGIKNGYIPRAEAVSRIGTALNFLQNADRFHGAWSHWISGTSGDVIPFSTMDNGGDLVETAFLVQGLICVREYFKNSTDTTEIGLSQKADQLWKEVEWNWYTTKDMIDSCYTVMAVTAMFYLYAFADMIINRTKIGRKICK